MSVAAHLGINVAEYDERIRTFIPQYDEMLDVAAAAVPRTARTIVDLGTGTGALGRRCLDALPAARLVGIDADLAILKIAKERLGPRATFVTGSFLRAPIPRCHAVVASLALHHVRLRGTKTRLFRRLCATIRRGGRLISVDCYPAKDPAVRRSQHAAWRAHLRRSYADAVITRLFSAWAREDVYVPLEVEAAMIADAGFRVEVLWRNGAFAVLMGIV